MDVLDSDQILMELALAKFGRVSPSQIFGQTQPSRPQSKFDQIRPSQAEKISAKLALTEI